MKYINNYITEKLQISSKTKKTNYTYTYNDIEKIFKPIHKYWWFDEVSWSDFDEISDEIKIITNDKFINKVYDISYEMQNNNIYVIHSNEPEKEPRVFIIFFDKNPFKYIIFYKGKFSDLIDSYTPTEVEYEINKFLE